MFLNRTSNFHLPIKKSLKGSALMMALFVLVIMSLLGGALVKMQMTSSENIAQEVLGTRALFAARSAMNIQIQQLFPLVGGVSVCPASTEYDFSAIQGLQQCDATVQCNLYATNNDVEYYRLTSVGECGSGTMLSDSKNIVLSNRTIQVEVRKL